MLAFKQKRQAYVAFQIQTLNFPIRTLKREVRTIIPLFHIQMLRADLRRAEGELEDRCWAPPPGLQQWLQLTHEVENRAYLRKKQQADMQLQQAREAVSRL